VAAKYSDTAAQIFRRTAEIIQSGTGQWANSNFSLADQRAFALGQAVKELIPGGQVWAMGTYQGEEIFGTVRSGLGIVTVAGQTLIVHAPIGGPVTVLGPLLP
jgi:hypothetical protein